MTGITRQIAAFVSAIVPDDLPPRAVEAATIGMADCVAVMIAGAAEEPVALVRELASPAQGDDAAPEIPSGRMLRAADAALVNGVAGHVLDYDDVALDGHPSVPLTPAILAEGYALGASGAEAITAYVAGYEAWAALIEREPGKFHDRGFHPTAIHGSLAAAAACARLNRLDPEKTAHALAIAASLAAGLVANFGTMTKSLHAGRAAQAGVIAARLARRGFTASPDVLEHRTGYLRAHSPSGEADVSEAGTELGQRWRIEAAGVNVKRYPICYATHRSIDAMIDLAGAHDLSPSDVTEIRVKIGETQRLMLRNHAPQNGLEAKFSIEFALASALVARQVGLAQLTDTFVRRPDVIAAMRKVVCTTTPEVMHDLPLAPADEVSVKLTSGRIIAHDPVAFARGSWANPMEEPEFRAKFMDCAGTALGDNQATSLYAAMTSLQNGGALRDLPFALRQ